MNKKFIPKQLQNPDFRFLKLKIKGKEPTFDMIEWQKKNFEYNDTELLNHLIKGGNYGIIGGYGNLILIDSDSEEINEIAKTMPETFTIKTGSPEEYKNHYYYIVEKPIKAIRLSREKVGDLGDIRGIGQYVVAPTSIHPSGNEYRVIKDVPIARISSTKIKEYFKNYIDGERNDENKKYPIDTTFRNSRFIKECRVPDYLINNKIKGNTSKNWTLFPYVVDILHNRRVSQSVYVELCKKQGHSIGAIKGWVKKAHEGKLAKTSCKKMQEYLKKFHPELINKICEKCPLYKTTKIVKQIKNNQNYNELQKKVLTYLTLRERDKATELIVKEIEKENYIYTTRDDVKSEMWIYNEGIYIPQGKSFVREFCRKILMEAFTSQLANNVIAKIETDTYIEHDKFFKTNYIFEVPLLNGILDIKTRELKPFNPKKIFFNKLPIQYDPSAECENILKHFKTILRDESDVKVIIELFGYCLLKEYPIEKAFMFVGKGRNGKSKTLELIKRFLGPDNCSALPLKMLNEESFSLSELFGKMANLASDLSNTDLKETGTIKSLIGRDLIQAKRKFLRDLNFVNYAKMIFATNELPKVYDTTDGFWTKWVLLEFPYKFITQKEMDNLPKSERINKKIIDPNIIDKITTPEEMSGLLNLGLDSLDKIIKQKDFSYSKGTAEVKNMWIRQSDSFMAFCLDHIEEKYGGIVTKKELRKYFSKYCKYYKIPGASDKGIKITLENNYGVIESQKFIGENRERVWEGIILKNLEEIEKK